MDYLFHKGQNLTEERHREGPIEIVSADPITEDLIE